MLKLPGTPSEPDTPAAEKSAVGTCRELDAATIGIDWGGGSAHGPHGGCNVDLHCAVLLLY
jgi:hypothetical protein